MFMVTVLRGVDPVTLTEVVDQHMAFRGEDVLSVVESSDCSVLYLRPACADEPDEGPSDFQVEIHVRERFGDVVRLINDDLRNEGV